MVKVVVKISVKNSEIDHFKQQMQALAPASRKDKGCISYGLFQELQQPNIFMIIEEWSSQEALSAHLQNAHVKKFESVMPGIVDCAPDPAILTVVEV